MTKQPELILLLSMLYKICGIMGKLKTAIHSKDIIDRLVILFTIWLFTWRGVMGLQVLPKQYHSTYKTELMNSRASGLFGPIEISPSALPHYPIPMEPNSPLYPKKPPRYDPMLTGKCPVNFTTISSILDKTASDCTQMLAAVVGNVICCPQLSSLLHIFRGQYSLNVENLLALDDSVAEDCYTDIVSLLVSRGANASIPDICSVQPRNLTSRFCAIKDLPKFEKTVNTSMLLEACSSVDPLKECCSPVCEAAITEAARQLSSSELGNSESTTLDRVAGSEDPFSDCKGVVYSWIARKLSMDDSNHAFRILSSCKVNKACPLNLGQPSEVAKVCQNVAAPSPSCCSSLNAYIGGLQKQMLLTNRQAIICAVTFGLLLEKAGVMINVYELCDVDLKDFSIQTSIGGPGCLLRSLPADVVFDNLTGYSITCDLNDNTGAPWPSSSSSFSSLSLCAEKSLPARPTSRNSGHAGRSRGRLKFMLQIVSLVAIITEFLG